MAHQDKVSEASVIEAFHYLARISLSEAEQDGLIDDAFLEEATLEELQILGPACEAIIQQHSQIPHLADMLDVSLCCNQ
jgi:hypothetical protein